MDDHALAAEAARRAGELLVRLRAEGGTGAQGDRQADDMLLPFLREHRPDDAILSEESKDDPARLDASRVWIVDPLDGTREYGEAGRTDWAVHVALVEDHTPTASAVALPAQGLVLGTDPAPALAPPTDGPIRILVSRTRPPELATRLAELLDAELVPMGSAGAKATAVAPRRRRRVRARRRPVRMGLRRAGRRRAGGRLPHLAPRRRAVALQPARPVPPRPPRVPPRARRTRPRRNRAIVRLKAWRVTTSSRSRGGSHRVARQLAPCHYRRSASVASPSWGEAAAATATLLAKVMSSSIAVTDSSWVSSRSFVLCRSSDGAV